ncbi:MAG: nuclear transport factor 2 family protein [Geminicoccaceae bacterium]
MTIGASTYDQLRDLYSIWAGSGGSCADVWLDLVSDDFQLNSTLGGSRHIEFSRQAHGKADLVAYFHGLIGDWDLTEFSINEIFAADDRIVVVMRQAYRNRRTDKVADGPIVHVWRFRGRQAIELQAFADTAKWVAAAKS